MKGRSLDLGLLILRLGVGCILIIYGSQKMLGLFGGHGFSNTVSTFQKMGFPPLLSTLAIFAEFFGSLGLILGLLSRVAAFGVFCTMAVATYQNAKAPGVIQAMFTSGNPSDVSKVTYSLILMLAALALILTGPGAFSIDSKLFAKRRAK